MSLRLTPSAYITHHLATWWPCFESLAPLHNPVSGGWSWQRLREHPGKPSPNPRALQAQALLLCLQPSSALLSLFPTQLQAPDSVISAHGGQEEEPRTEGAGLPFTIGTRDGPFIQATSLQPPPENSSLLVCLSLRGVPSPGHI